MCLMYISSSGKPAATQVMVGVISRFPPPSFLSLFLSPAFSSSFLSFFPSSLFSFLILYSFLLSCLTSALPPFFLPPFQGVKILFNPILSYFFDKILFCAIFWEMSYLSYFLAILPLILVFYGLFLTIISRENIP